mmetsp:Transcript_21851/g.35354  ORF Transcript_21851/g.35354 Transcript_21851/m.35354 type:complete len:125 (-) Transcript_21851:56-430(-)
MTTFEGMSPGFSKFGGRTSSEKQPPRKENTLRVRGRAPFSCPSTELRMRETVARDENLTAIEERRKAHAHPRRICRANAVHRILSRHIFSMKLMGKMRWQVHNEICRNPIALLMFVIYCRSLRH